MDHTPINIENKFNMFSEQWSPKIIAQMNDYHFKIAKIQGKFIWHSHPDTDEVFMIHKGSMQIQFRDGVVHLDEGEMFVIPKGVEHNPIAEDECHILMIELAGTVNTGDAGGDRTIEQTSWV
jgi:mannose-6-phosphate isomerase-like protein (cupin superfamily)